MKPYKAQLDAVAACVNHHHGMLAMPTGTGKSFTMMLLVHALQVRTLIIVPNIHLKQQLKEIFIKNFGSLNNILIENIQSTTLLKETDYDLLILDEAHHSSSSTYRNLNKKAWNNIYYRFYFSATPFRNKDEEQLLLESITGPVIYELFYQEAVKENMITPIEAYYIELPKTEPEGNIKSWPSMYSELVVNNKIRNQKIADLLLKLNDSNISTLCLVKEIKHGNTLKDMTNGFFASGINEDTPYLIQMFNNRKINVLIGTTGVLGEGVDTRPTEYVIIAGLGKSKPQFMQQCGRAFRRFEGKESAKIILIKDPSHKYTINHFKEQCKILKEEYGMGIIKLDI